MLKVCLKTGAVLAMLALPLFTFSGSAAQADSGLVETRGAAPLNKAIADDSIGVRRGSFIFAPIPTRSPMLGTGLALGLGYLFQTDPESSASTIGFGAFRTENGSRAVAGLADLYLLQDRWHINALYTEAALNYDLITPVVGAVPLAQDATLGQLTATYSPTESFSIGPKFRYLDTSIATNLALLPPQYQPDLGLRILSAGLSAGWDTRDDTLYPTSGERITLSASRSFVTEGVLPDYDKGTALFDLYRSLGPQSVFALRGTLCAASSDTPFFDQCSVGGTDAMRGFNSTRFLNERMASLQAEYRHRFGKRLGGVIFAGTGAVGDSFSDLDDRGSAVGLGLRYRVSRKFPVDFTIDGAYNSEDNSTFYISVGQRF